MKYEATTGLTPSIFSQYYPLIFDHIEFIR